MRKSILASVALALTFVSVPAHADLITPGALMETDLFQWSNWRQIISDFDCTPEFSFYLWNAPNSAPVAPLVEPLISPFEEPTFTISDPTPCVGCDPSGGGTSPVPETSTWAMMAIGFASLGWAGFRQRRRNIIVA